MRVLYFLLPIVLTSLFLFRLHNLNNNQTYFGSKVSLEGIIETQVDSNREEYHFLVNGTPVIYSQNNGNELGIGDLIIIVGSYKERVINPLYREKWLQAQDIKIVQKYDEKSVKISDIRSLLLEYRIRLFNLKQNLIKTFRQLFSLNSAGLMAGMVLGAGEEIPFSLYNSMKESGLAHLVVASGSNIALVAAVSMSIFSFLSKRARYLVAMSIVLSYMVMAGLEPPVVRATIMILLVWVAKLIGRKTSSLWVLLLTALTMVVITPPILFSLSFQLSIAATSGIILFSEPFETLSKYLFSNVPFGAWVLGLISQTIAAQICILPLLLHYFGQTNFISIFANGVVSWLVTPLVVGGMVLLGLQVLVPWLAQLAAIPLELLLRYLAWVGTVTSVSKITVLNFTLDWTLVFIYWLGLGLVYHKLKQKFTFYV